MPKKPFVLYEKDFIKTLMDYQMFEKGIDIKDFEEKLVDKILYSSKISSENEKTVIALIGGDDDEKD